mmetsp:Transcript_12982/g.17752  ORF Transcript_12982/g.17752 Transcript_12982/m.17752 type:complete len:287 (-) Transcript_12982:185-1045(-)
MAEVDSYAEAKESVNAALQAKSIQDFAKYFTDKFKHQLQIVRCVFMWMVRHGSPKCPKIEDLPHWSLESVPVLRAELEQAEEVLSPNDGQAASGLWAERTARLFTQLLRACGLEANEVMGYYAPPEWMPHEWMPLVAPNSMWTMVNVNKLWRLVDIAKAVQEQTVDEFFTTPEIFFRTHYPLTSQYQLLANPLPMPEFWPTVTEIARLAAEKRAREAKAAAEKLENDTRNASSQFIADTAVVKVVDEVTHEIALPGIVASQAIAFAIASENERSTERSSSGTGKAP